MSDSLQPHGRQHTRLPCLSPTPRACSDSCPSNHDAMVMPSNHLILCRPLLLPLSIFPRIRVFSSESVLHIRWPSIGSSASVTVLPMNIQDWFLLGLTSWISFQLDGRQNENHNHVKLTKLITWTTALSNSMKLWAMPCRATQDGRVTVENSDKTWSSGEGSGKPLQYSCLENPMNGMKRGVGGKSKKEEVYIHIADSLHRTAETNTTLNSNYTPIMI